MDKMRASRQFAPLVLQVRHHPAVVRVITLAQLPNIAGISTLWTGVLVAVQTKRGGLRSYSWSWRLAGDISCDLTLRMARALLALGR